ncbi:hypothetical protein [Robbsia andropogonis]|uniref:hypothetical protein n=1 Tax=Robbsia andropogonis TaxID=28092 RepID=UPI00209CF908|nr:hypothetical protein [Robbsia andropogonis]MCP1119395.1 hypothetical protein [Robbsia andropogonis]MCP1129378.1 hypothetical protein [Robbsia andropogonis]
MDIARSTLSSLWDSVTYDDQAFFDADESEHRDTICELPNELIYEFAFRLPEQHLFNLASTNQKFYKILCLQCKSIKITKSFYDYASKATMENDFYDATVIMSINASKADAFKVIRITSICAMQPSFLRSYVQSVPLSALKIIQPDFCLKQYDVPTSKYDAFMSLVNKGLDRVFYVLSLPVGPILSVQDKPICYLNGNGKLNLDELGFDTSSFCDVLTKQEQLIKALSTADSLPLAKSDAFALIDLMVARWIVHHTFDSCCMSPCNLLRKTDKVLWPAMLDSLLSSIPSENLSDEIMLFIEEYDGSGGYTSSNIQNIVSEWLFHEKKLDINQVKCEMRGRFNAELD